MGLLNYATTQGFDKGSPLYLTLVDCDQRKYSSKCPCTDRCSYWSSGHRTEDGSGHRIRAVAMRRMAVRIMAVRIMRVMRMVRVVRVVRVVAMGAVSVRTVMMWLVRSFYPRRI